MLAPSKVKKHYVVFPSHLFICVDLILSRVLSRIPIVYGYGNKAVQVVYVDLSSYYPISIIPPHHLLTSQNSFSHFHALPVYSHKSTHPFIEPQIAIQSQSVDNHYPPPSPQIADTIQHSKTNWRKKKLPGDIYTMFNI
jgi:hypothetical protein